MFDNVHPLVYVAIALFIVSVLATLIARRIISNNLLHALYERDNITFNRLLEKRYTKYFVNEFNLYYMQLNQAFMNNKPEEITEAFSRFDSLKLKQNQKELLYTNAFYYFASKNDEKQAQKYLNLVNDMKLCKDKENINLYYSICFEHNTQCLDVLLEMLNEAHPQQRQQISFMISKVYQNMGNKKKAEEYLMSSLKK